MCDGRIISMLSGPQFIYPSSFFVGELVFSIIDERIDYTHRAITNVQGVSLCDYTDDYAGVLRVAVDSVLGYSHKFLWTTQLTTKRPSRLHDDLVALAHTMNVKVTDATNIAMFVGVFDLLVSKGAVIEMETDGTTAICVLRNAESEMIYRGWDKYHVESYYDYPLTKHITTTFLTTEVFHRVLRMSSFLLPDKAFSSSVLSDILGRGILAIRDIDPDHRLLLDAVANHM